MKLTEIKTPMDLELFIKSRDSIMFSDTLKEGQLYYIVQYQYNVRYNEFTGIKFIPEKLCSKKADSDSGLFYGLFNNIYLTGVLGDIMLPAGVIPNCYIFENICDASQFANVVIRIGLDAIKILESHTSSITNKLTQKMLSEKCRYSTNNGERAQTKITGVDHQVTNEQINDLAQRVGDAKELLFGANNRNTSWEDIINRGHDIQTKLDDMLISMKKLHSSNDAEYAHGDADEILCEALKLFSQEELVEAWNKVKKYYA